MFSTLELPHFYLSTGDCPRPVLPPHSSLKGGGVLEDSYTAETVLNFQCIPGYENIPGIMPRMTCLETSKWSDLPTFCQESCDYPPRLVSAELMDEYKEKDFFPVGSTVKYKCRPGYMKKAGTYSSTCNRNQQWSKVQELCKRKTCGHPGEPDGGRLLVTGDFDLGSTAHYHTYSAKKDTKCSFQFSTFPLLLVIPCSPPPKIPHGKYDGEYLHSFYYGTVVKYTCDKDYPLIGNASIYCTSKDGINGEWSGHAYCGGEFSCPNFWFLCSFSSKDYQLLIGNM
uniref:Sushi domain-containing protein n=1 Tax=Laticauda laticaudata TaxID=8630 RepID=A0A8C5WYI6_LATLA